MLDKLDRSVPAGAKGKERLAMIADAGATRLKAVVLTTVTTVVAIMPTAYGFFGYDSMLSQMMLVLSWGLIYGTLITLVLIPCIYTFIKSPGIPEEPGEPEASPNRLAFALPAGEMPTRHAQSEEAYMPKKPRATTAARSAAASRGRATASTRRPAGKAPKGGKR
jgi:hypothetical protein